MPTPSSSARPLLRIGAAVALAAAGALAAAPRPALGGASSPAGDPPGSSTCRVCHTDAKFGSSFSHAGLDESADGCATCHGDGTAHVASRNGKGSIAHPKKGAAAAEFELCLACHEEEEFRTPKHLEPKGKDARCTACHDLHGGVLPVRAAAPGGKAATDIRPKAPAPVGPVAGRAWARGRVEAGWRFVGGEEGRYDQDVNLDDGPRLLAVDASAGLDDADPLAPRLDLAASGLGDPVASARRRARAGGRWSVVVGGRPGARPVPGAHGRHGGGGRRATRSASMDLRLDRTFRAAAGYDRVDVEGDVAGTLFDNGVVVPVSGDADRLSDRAWASLSGRGRGWHASLRQAWLWETGRDGRSRDFSAPAAPDFYAFDDDSRMTGPRTAAIVGAESRDGRFSIEARGSRTDLERDVDLLEHRRSVVASTTVERRAVTEGTKELLLHDGAVDGAFAFTDRWALEGGISRRALREDGRTETTTTLDSGGGPVTTAGRSDQSVSHILLEERLALRHTLEGGFQFRGGVEAVSDALDDRGPSPRAGTVRTRGFFGGAEGKITPELTFRGEFHTARSSGQFTPMDPEDHGTWRAAAAWRDAEGWRAGTDWTYSRFRSRDSGLDVSGNQLRVWGGVGLEDGFTADASYTVRKQTTEVDTRSFVSSTLADGKASSEIRAHLLTAWVGIPLAARLRLTASATWVEDLGSLPLRTFDGALGLRWEISKTLAARVEVLRRSYDETGVEALDYTADILQVSLEMRF